MNTCKAGLQEKDRTNTGRSSGKQTGNRLKQEVVSVFSEVNQGNGSDGASPSPFLAWSRAFCVTLGSSSLVNKGVNIFF